jgi:hypothetical protein
MDLLSCAAEKPMGLALNYIVVDGQTFSKAKLVLDNHVYKNCRLILNQPARDMYAAVQIFKMKSPGSTIVAD